MWPHDMKKEHEEVQKDLSSGKLQHNDIDIVKIAKIGLNLFTRFSSAFGQKL